MTIGRRCPACGAPAPAQYRFCLECGQSLQPMPPPRPSPPPQHEPVVLHETGEPRESTQEATGRVVVTFAIVGAGLGIGTMLFLWITGFFGAIDSIGDLGRVFLGGVALAGALTFALPIGVVLAAWGGTEIGRSASDRSGVFRAAAIACGMGHGALLVVLGVILVIGVVIASFGDAGTSVPPGVTFDEPSDVGGDLLTILKLSLSIVPAGLVGGATAAMNTRR